MGYKRKEYENMESLFTNGKKKFVKYEEGAAMYSMGIHAFTELAKEALEKNVDVEDILELSVREQIGRAKYIPETEMSKFDEILAEIKSEMRALTDEGGI